MHKQENNSRKKIKRETWQKKEQKKPKQTSSSLCNAVYHQICIGIDTEGGGGVVEANLERQLYYQSYSFYEVLW